MPDRILLESFTARGHPNVQACHKTTLEFTTESYLTRNGDCIAGVCTTMSPEAFKKVTKDALQSNRDFILEIRVGDLVEEIHGKGHPDLALDDDKEMVFRKSTFVSGRTVLISCDKASIDLSSELRNLLVREDVHIQISLFQVD